MTTTRCIRPSSPCCARRAGRQGYASPRQLMGEMRRFAMGLPLTDESLPDASGLELQSRGDLPGAVRAVKSAALSVLEEPVEDGGYAATREHASELESGHAREGGT